MHYPRRVYINKCEYINSVYVEKTRRCGVKTRGQSFFHHTGQFVYRVFIFNVFYGQF